ncbi:hypothetical protein EDD16DRAFT_1552462 [Pisolithus croceorrhizus]|nr:hypothetical protein EDD16DRAFT_1552462 [Pisolithus croceorrhizus]
MALHTLNLLMPFITLKYSKAAVLVSPLTSMREVGYPSVDWDWEGSASLHHRWISKLQVHHVLSMWARGPEEIC